MFVGVLRFNFHGPGDFLRVANESYTALEALSSPGYNLTGRPWGLGAFGTTNFTEDPKINRCVQASPLDVASIAPTGFLLLHD